MKTLEEAWEIIEGLNDQAHDEAWDTWTLADELADSDDEENWERAEDTREQASLEQAEYFRDAWDYLPEDKQTLVKHWLGNDKDFREQFATYYGQEEFNSEFGGETHG